MGVQDQRVGEAESRTGADEGVSVLHAADREAERYLLLGLLNPGYACFLRHHGPCRHGPDHPFGFNPPQRLGI